MWPGIGPRWWPVKSGGDDGEIGYWIAADVRGRGIAPAVVRAATQWAFKSFGASRLPRIMLVHDVENLASCRVAEKAGYPFEKLSPANPPHWFTDGHIHMRRVRTRPAVVPLTCR
jgi:RimJ/RimL family protein N-acetyltransferase